MRLEGTYYHSLTITHFTPLLALHVWENKLANETRIGRLDISRSASLSIYLLLSPAKILSAFQRSGIFWEKTFVTTLPRASFCSKFQT